MKCWRKGMSEDQASVYEMQNRKSRQILSLLGRPRKPTMFAKRKKIIFGPRNKLVSQYMSAATAHIFHLTSLNSSWTSSSETSISKFGGWQMFYLKAVMRKVLRAAFALAIFPPLFGYWLPNKILFGCCPFALE
eukprot:1162064-Pelagomonas_calceolata.AAC.9